MNPNERSRGKTPWNDMKKEPLVKPCLFYEWDPQSQQKFETDDNFLLMIQSCSCWPLAWVLLVWHTHMRNCLNSNRENALVTWAHSACAMRISSVMKSQMDERTALQYLLNKTAMPQWFMGMIMKKIPRVGHFRQGMCFVFG